MFCKTEFAKGSLTQPIKFFIPQNELKSYYINNVYNLNHDTTMMVFYHQK